MAQIFVAFSEKLNFKLKYYKLWNGNNSMLCTCRLAIEIDEKQAHITQTRARCQKMQGKRIIFFLLFIVWTYFKKNFTNVV